MKRIGESIRFAWDETSRLEVGRIRRSGAFFGALGKIARMRTALVIESVVDESYTEPSDTTEEHVIRNFINPETGTLNSKSQADFK